MTFDPKLMYGSELNNAQLMNIFKCSPQGGMRKSNTTNTLVIISDHTQPYYEDRWKGDTFYYTGMGLEGNQRLDYSQNRALDESNENGVDVFLFEVNTPTVYTFGGKVVLAGKPFKESQPDKNGNSRTVWIFPLKLATDSPLITEEEFIKRQTERERRASELSSKN